jgi:serine/threonine-protein kinase RsbW
MSSGVRTVGSDGTTSRPNADVGVREASLVLGLPPEERCVGAARRRVSAFLALSDLATDDAESLVLVTSELCTNAVHAAEPEDDSEVVLGCRIVEGEVEVEVTNRGDGFEVDEPKMPPPEATSGRGLSLVTMLTDGLDIRHGDGRTTVRARRRVTGRTADRGGSAPARLPNGFS